MKTHAKRAIAGILTLRFLRHRRHHHRHGARR